MLNRRHFLAAAGALAATGPGWAAAASPACLAAARAPDGGFALHGLTGGGAALFRIPLPGRGHAAAAHPDRPEAIAFARRPGTFATVIDCAQGCETARLEAPEGRHFFGHGTFSRDGRVLFTTENDIETGAGRIGLWDAAAGYARLGDLPSGGTGPHDILRLPDGRLMVANGGIETSPDSGRSELNLATMRSCLSRIDPATGAVTGEWTLPAALRLNSIRHLAQAPDGTIAMGLQWQGSKAEAPPLLALLDPGAGTPRLLAAPEALQRQMQGYVASVAFDGAGRQVAVTSPRGGLVLIFDAGTGAFRDRLQRVDVSGAAPAAGGFLFSDGTGEIVSWPGAAPPARHALQWDNHLIRVG